LTKSRRRQPLAQQPSGPAEQLLDAALHPLLSATLGLFRFHSKSIDEVERGECRRQCESALSRGSCRQRTALNGFA